MKTLKHASHVRPSFPDQQVADFTQRVKDTRLKGKLESALGGRGSFHRFRDALKEYPELEKEWFKFKADRDKEEVKDWLESIGIEMEGVKRNRIKRIT